MKKAMKKLNKKLIKLPKNRKHLAENDLLVDLVQNQLFQELKMNQLKKKII